MNLSRRQLFAGAASAVAVYGFDPVAGIWVSEARAGCIRAPDLRGELVFESTAIAEAAEDFGHIEHRLSWAVLRPGNFEDVVRMVRFANQQGLPIAMRGQGHSVLGQAQAPSGIVIDSRSLNRIHRLDADGAIVETGVTWSELVTRATAVGLTPPVLTDYLHLSIGGVLSVGGVGGSSHRHGLVVDQVEELTVVTGQGELVTCSSRHHRVLFESTLGGLGQFALILQAKLRLRAAHAMARVYQLVYTDLSRYLRAHRALDGTKTLDFLQGLVSPGPEGGWQYILQCAQWYDSTPPPSPLDPLSADLAPLATEISDLPYLAWTSRVDQFVAGWASAGVWTTPHPWSDLFLPDDAVEAFVTKALANTTPADVGAGVILLYPLRRGGAALPFLRTPAGDRIWLFDILRFAPSDPNIVQGMLNANRALLDQAVAIGGKRYPISAVRMRPADWVAHYDSAYPALVIRKAAFDPRNVLTPGQRIFRQ
ncbi:MAG TPA: FAD-binding protein [Polyangiaceae bacterium]|nr:FAD-binding protein [Polyangiaceae bacterium]